MKCPKCDKEMQKIKVKVEGAKNKVLSYQCPKCDYFEFEKDSAEKVIKELKIRETPLTIKQKLVKLSHDRLGMYFNKNIVRSLNLKPGEDIYVSIPDRNHIVLNLKT